MTPSPTCRRRPLSVRLALSTLAALASLITIVGLSQLSTRTVSAATSAINISQFQTGGDGTQPAADEFIELHNTGSTNFDLNGHRLVYRSAAGASDTELVSWTTSTLIAPGGYYLIANSTGYNASLTPNRTFTSSGTGTLAGGGGGLAIRQGASNTGTIVDSVGYGTATNIFVEGTPTAAPPANDSRARKSAGCQDTNNNSNDFAAQTPSAPRNSSSPAVSCGATLPGQFIISEYRLRGPGGSSASAFGGFDRSDSDEPSTNIRISDASDEPPSPSADTSPAANDEFIEFYNNTDAPITVTTSDNSAGWALVASDGITRFIIPNNTVIPARGHFLAVNLNGYSLRDSPAGNNGASETTATGDTILLPDANTLSGGYTTEIPDLSGIAIFKTANAANFNTTNRLDAVGYSTAPALYREGAGFAADAPGREVNGIEYSFYRDLRNGYHRDTDDNAADFRAVATGGSTTTIGAHLGAPAPENLNSPVVRFNRAVLITLFDPQTTANQAPNRVRQPCGAAPVCDSSTSSLGTLSIRRTITNNTGANVTRLRFRLIDITTLPAPSATADLRAITSSNIMLTRTDGTSLPVQGTTLEQPPSQPSGGGFNSALGVGSVTLTTPLAPGASINVQFLLGVQQGGSFRFIVNTEALP